MAPASLFLAPISLLTLGAVTEADSSTFTPAAITTAIEACRGGNYTVFDAHLHLTSRTPTQSGGDLVAELKEARIDGGLLYSVYIRSGTAENLADPNEEVARILSSGGAGRILGLASLNTSDWSGGGKKRQLLALRNYLSRPGFVGVKLAPPHTCLELNGLRIEAVARVVNQTTITYKNALSVATTVSPALFIHSGTTPFCPGGPFGDDFACCDDLYVNLTKLEPLIAQFNRFPWVLLHSGYDFTTSYRTDIIDQALRLASLYPHVFLEVSAMFATGDDDEFRYPVPGGRKLLSQIQSRELVNKTIFGSDGNWRVNGVKKALRLTVKAMLELNFTQTEMCRVLGGSVREVFSFQKE